MKMILANCSILITLCLFLSLHSSKSQPSFLRQKSFLLSSQDTHLSRNKRSLSLFDSQSNNYFDSLVQLIDQGKMDQAKSLVEDQGNKQDPWGRTFLHYAAIHSLDKVLSFLLNHAIKKDLPDAQGRTALHYAAAHRSSKSVIALINARVNTYILDSTGKTALHYAALHGCIENIYTLRKYININAQDNNGKTALHYTVIENSRTEEQNTESHLHAAQILLQLGALPNIADYNGKTALYYTVTKTFKSPALLHSLLKERTINLSLRYYCEGDIFDIAVIHWPECIGALAERDLAGFLSSSEHKLPPQINFSQE